MNDPAQALRALLQPGELSTTLYPPNSRYHGIGTATLMAGIRRAAVINDELIYLGDSIPGGGTLTSVERDRIVVTDSKGVTHTLAVKEGDA